MKIVETLEANLLLRAKGKIVDFVLTSRGACSFGGLVFLFGGGEADEVVSDDAKVYGLLTWLRQPLLLAVLLGTPAMDPLLHHPKVRELLLLSECCVELLDPGWRGDLLFLPRDRYPVASVVHLKVEHSIGHLQVCHSEETLRAYFELGKSGVFE